MGEWWGRRGGLLVSEGGWCWTGLRRRWVEVKSRADSGVLAASIV